MNKKFNIYKNVFIILILAAVIFASVVIYHLQHKQTPLLATNNVTLFNSPRALKEFNLMQNNDLPFTQNQLKNHWTLLYFGFTHCPHICPTTSETLASAYENLKTVYPNLQVVLVTVDPQRDTPDVISSYVKNFHQDFIGVSGNEMEIRKLQSQLGIYSEKEESKDNKVYQMQHTSSILLFDPKGHWAGTIRYGLTPTQLMTVSKQSIQALNG